LIYIPVALIALLLYGSGIIEDDLLFNVAYYSYPSIGTYLSKISFIIVISCHIPFLIFTGKESFLVLVDETKDKTFSKVLE
jgi:hypothetical protein